MFIGLFAPKRLLVFPFLAGAICSTLLMPVSTPAAPSLPQALTNTSWRLVEIQSMDDAQPPKRPIDRTKYTLTLATDGALKLKLDCNQYQGKWSAQASSELSTGSLLLGPVMGTKMACPSPSYGPQLSVQIENIRSYLLKDGKLYLSLKADGGIWVWEPLHQFNNQPNQALEAAIFKQYPDYSNVNQGDDPALSSRYIYNQVDLNGDGKNELLVYLLGPAFCGTGGCQLLILSAQYQVIGEMSLVSTPIQVSSQAPKGWKQLSWTQTGGGAPAQTVVARFNGKKYTVAPGKTALPGTHYLQGFREFQQGAVLNSSQKPANPFKQRPATRQ